MIQASGVIICLSYIIGLLSTAIPWSGFLLPIVGIVGALIAKRSVIVFRKSLQKQEKQSGKTKTALQPRLAFLNPKLWLAAGLVGLLASFYLQLRFPQPIANDISKFVPENNQNQEQLMIVRGEVLTSPRLTRSQRGQFWLKSRNLDQVRKEATDSGSSQNISGKLYVTVPLLQATGLYPGQQVDITGILYKPKPALNPGGFDFQKYLQREGSFAGMSGRLLTLLDKQKERPWGWWILREKIVRSQVRWLGVPKGPLVSAMVLGNKAVDLPYEISDSFILVGLAHALSASGFQTSLILGVVLGLTKRFSAQTQFFAGSAALLIFLGLAGFLPPVLRATVMGFGALIALVLRKKVQQLGSLLLAATLLLLFNPLWIWDLGFQLSFLSTLGLIVTATPITQSLQWLPTTIASIISIPLAAAIWTLPLQLYMFGTIPSYSLLVNILSTPLVGIISLGGFISAIAALILPEAGSAIAFILNYPTDLLIELVKYFSRLPGSSVALGSISIIQFISIYILIILAWLVTWWQKRWWLAGLMSIGLIFIPAWHSTNNLFRVTLLASGNEPVIVIQDKANITLINSGDEGTARYSILPFLQQQGVNQIDSGIASDFEGDSSSSWLEVLQRIQVKKFYDFSATPENAISSKEIQKQILNRQGNYENLSTGQNVNINSTVIQLINQELPILQLQILGQNWLLVGNLKPEELSKEIKSGSLARPQLIWCHGETLKDLVVALKPQVAITDNANLNEKDMLEMSTSQTKIFYTGRDGAVQWTPNGQFEKFVQTAENRDSVL